jgi:hypothetical protein
MFENVHFLTKRAAKIFFVLRFLLVKFFSCVPKKVSTHIIN